MHTAFKAYCGVLLGPVEVPPVILVLIPLTHWQGSILTYQDDTGTDVEWMCSRANWKTIGGTLSI